MFKHKGLQHQLVDAKLQQTAQLIKEADGKHQSEREFVSSIPLKKYIAGQPSGSMGLELAQVCELNSEQ